MTDDIRIDMTAQNFGQQKYFRHESKFSWTAHFSQPIIYIDENTIFVKKVYSG